VEAAGAPGHRRRRPPGRLARHPTASQAPPVSQTTTTTHLRHTGTKPGVQDPASTAATAGNRGPVR